MQAGNEMTTPDLQSILATLAQHSSNGLTAPNTSLQQNGSSAPSSSDLQKGSEPGIDSSETSQDPRLRARPTPQSHSTQAPAKPMIDPSKITTWQDALRCVTKIAAQNAQFAVSIKKMMQDQKAHEMRWYTERQNLKQTQSNRSSSAAKAQSILKALNPGFQGAASACEQADVNPEAELKSFDRKIYAAQQDMERAMTVELKALGVPFFGTDKALIVADDHEQLKVKMTEERPKWSPMVTESQLMTLRRRMVQHLEDLYRE